MASWTVSGKRACRASDPMPPAHSWKAPKAFTKDFLQRYQIPTAAYQCFDELGPALQYIREQGAPIVVKADGLAAGKGVIVAHTLHEAEERGHQHAQRSVVLVTPEIESLSRNSSKVRKRASSSSRTVTTCCHLPVRRITKLVTRATSDRIPAAWAPILRPPLSRLKSSRSILDLVIRPTLAGLREDGINYTGFLYAGLMITPDGTPKVIEFNCRMGDPETQPIMARLKSDLVELCEATLNGRLAEETAEWDPRAALGVVMAAGGYPAGYEKGKMISGLPDIGTSGALVFHAGTAMNDEEVVTSGGRVLCVVGLGNSVADARDMAYEQGRRHSLGRRLLSQGHRPPGYCAGKGLTTPMLTTAEASQAIADSIPVFDGEFVELGAANGRILTANSQGGT